MDEKEVQEIKDSNRDVYLNKGDVHLKNYQYRIYENPNTKDKN